MSKTIKRLSIDRAKWGRGSLLDKTGKKCCLGHLGTACGVSDAAMLDSGMPSDLSEEDRDRYPLRFLDGEDEDYEVALIAQGINDNGGMSRPEREYRLKILFRAHGIKLTFRGKP